MTATLDARFGVIPGQDISTAWDSPLARYEMHQSQLNTLVGMCAKRFEFEHIQQLPKGRTSQYRLSQGLAAHNVVEGVLNGIPKTLGTLMNEQWSNTIMPQMMDVNYDKALDEYENNVNNALQWINDNFDPTRIQSEKQFRIPNIWQLSNTLEGIDERWAFAGSMDLIQLDHVAMKAKIVDMKFRERTNAANNRSSAQAPMYSLAAMYYGYEPEFTFVEFVRGKIIEQRMHIGEGELEWMFIKTRQAIDYIERAEFPINPNGWWCSSKYCDYWSVCRGKYESDAEATE